MREMEVSENVVDFMVSKILQLPLDAQEVLAAASCIGAVFDWEQLGVVLDQDRKMVAAAVLRTVEEEFVVPIGMGYKQVYAIQGGVVEVGGLETGKVSFAFLHDRVQQAAYSLLPEEVRKRAHYQLGRWLQAEGRPSGGEERLFEQVNHLNEAWEYLSLWEERVELARLNLEAGRRAKSSVAYEIGRNYVALGIELLTEAGWQSCYELMFALHQERMELEYLCGQFEEAHRLFEQLKQVGQSEAEILAIHITMIRVLHNESRHQEATRIGLEALQFSGFKKTLKPSRLTLLREILRVKWRLRKKTSEQLLQIPETIDAKVSIWLELMTLVGTSAYIGDPELTLLLNCYGLNLTLDHGTTKNSANFFNTFGLTEAFLFHNYDAAYRYGQLGIEMEKRKVSDCTGEGYVSQVVSVFFLSPWKESFQGCANELKRMYPFVLESGNLLSAMHCISCAMLHTLNSGRPLAELARETERCYNVGLRLQMNEITNTPRIVRGMILNLRGESEGLGNLQYEGFDEKLYQEQLTRNDYVPDSLPTYYYVKSLLLFLGEEYEQATEYARPLVYDSRLNNHVNAMVFRFYYALAVARCDSQANRRQQHKRSKELTVLCKRLKKAAETGPANFENKRLLVEAEMQRLKGQKQQAIHLYEGAIAAALEQGLLHEAAIANECAGVYMRSLGQEREAKLYLMAARQGFLEWGATAKARQLEQRYPDLFEHETSLSQRTTPVDYLAVIKATQAISEEIVLQNLKEKMMQVLLQNAGAESGTLLFEHEGQFLPYDATDRVSFAAVHYVLRTGEPLVLHDAGLEGLFAGDPSIQNRQVKSLLCLPITHRGKRVCLLYLENNLTTHAFTPERIEMLQILSAQFAISIENATLYASLEESNLTLEEKVQERTADLEATNKQLGRSMRETAAAWAEVAVLEERTRIAHEIHDVVGHTLTTAIVQLEASKRLADKDVERAMKTVDQAQEHIRNSLNEIRYSVRMLKDDLSDLELGVALEKLIWKSQDHTGIRIEHQIDSLPDLDVSVKKMLYHALQEGLTNGIRHGGSTHFQFRLRQEQGVIFFDLRDNGRGNDEIQYGFGLTAMKERVEGFGGRLQVEANEDRGWAIRLQVPVESSILI